MIGKRNIRGMAAIGGLSSAIALLTGLPAVSADELADLRAKQALLQNNQELLQKRIDQLSQAPPGAPGPYVPGFGPETRPTAAPVTTGSFPRSFLIPGTDTSLRIGGIAWTNVEWYLQGARRSTALNSQGGNPDGSTQGIGGTGNLPNIPLNSDIGHSRSGAFDVSSRNSRLLFDARTPTAWGEVKAYIEFDFSHANENVTENTTQGVASGWAPRLRKAYGTMGGFLAGQETGIFHDPDADPELVDVGGTGASIGRAREPQVKYTYQGPYGVVLTGGFENPVPRSNGQFGQIDIDTLAVPTVAPCSVAGNTTAALPATTACIGSTAFFNALKSSYPELIGTARINNPWGHVQVGVVVRNDTLNDGQYLDSTHIGYGGAISGDVHPFSGAPGPLGKDDLGFGVGAGTEIGGQFSNGIGVNTNFGRSLFVPGLGFVNPLSAGGGAAGITGAQTTTAWNSRGAQGVVNGINVRQAYDGLVRSSSPSSYNGWIWYQHWWTENLRSTLEVSGIWNAFDTGLIGPCTSCNKLLSTAHANLFWSPVAFVDFGAEYGWGHRVTTQNFKGDAYVIQGTMRVRF
jgi:hypothetical protein